MPPFLTLEVQFHLVLYPVSIIFPSQFTEKNGMTDEAKKFISRAPRYSLRPGDDQYFRYAFAGDRTHTFTTRFVNISMSGLAFITDLEHSPQMGDRIKVEFPIDTGEHVAWWARVIRIEEYIEKKKFPDPLNEEPPQVIVAVTFDHLPEGHHEAVRKSVEHKFAEISRRARQERMDQAFEYLEDNGKQLFIMVAALLFTAFALWWLAQPSDNYDPSIGTPWGERFRNSPSDNK